MLLSELVITNIGPFAQATKIQFEDDVTVLTGANDCGKTSVLTAVELLCGMSGNARVLQEHEVNLDRIGHATTSWKKDTEITCEAILKTTEHSRPHLKREMAPGGEISVLCRLAPEGRQMANLKFRQVRGRGGWSQGGSVAIKTFPTTIRLPLAEPVQTIIDLKKPNPTELEFLRSAFGPQFSHEKYAALTESAYFAALSKARGDTNAKLRRFLPPSISLQFDFQSVNDDRGKISIQLRDGHEGHTPLGVRGAGVGRLVSLMATLLSSDLNDRHYIILIDEPENSLHADVQHTLRAVLESLGNKPNIQVIYATHSPSMINPIRTASLRMLQRENNGQDATSTVNHRPVDENFFSIRSSLGLTASDSLLYAPVTLIVEGPSEVIGLPIILGRLWQAGVDGFEDVDQLLSLAHFLDGCGDSFDQLCKVAVSQGTKPVVFLDGDKAGSRLKKLRDRFAEVPIVLLDGGSEFEEIVTREVYFSALAEVMSEFNDRSHEKLTLEQFTEWESQNSLHDKMAFSKRVDRWVQCTLDLSVEKPLVMKHALRNTPLESVETGKLLELLNQMRAQLS